MKTNITTLIAILTAVFVIGCGKSDNKTTTDSTNKTEQKNDTRTLGASETDKTVEIQTSGMTCAGCENTIKSKVKKVEGVKEVMADHNTNVVKASYDPSKTNTDAIKNAITAAGYKVESVK